MKISRVFWVFMFAFLMSGCNGQAQETAEMLENEQQREEIMTAISNDHNMMVEMMSHIMESNHAMQMMEGNTAMLGRMMGNRQMMMDIMVKDTAIAKGMMDNIMVMMEKDSTMCSMMGGMMMGNEHMMGMMQNKGKSMNMIKGGMMHQKQNKEMKLGNDIICPKHGK